MKQFESRAICGSRLTTEQSTVGPELTRAGSSTANTECLPSLCFTPRISLLVYSSAVAPGKSDGDALGPWVLFHPASSQGSSYPIQSVDSRSLCAHSVMLIVAWPLVRPQRTQKVTTRVKTIHASVISGVHVTQKEAIKKELGRGPTRKTSRRRQT